MLYRFYRTILFKNNIMGCCASVTLGELMIFFKKQFCIIGKCTELYKATKKIFSMLNVSFMSTVSALLHKPNWHGLGEGNKVSNSQENANILY